MFVALILRQSRQLESQQRLIPWLRFHWELRFRLPTACLIQKAIFCCAICGGASIALTRNCRERAGTFDRSRSAAHHQRGKLLIPTLLATVSALNRARRFQASL